jgi:hypothetical protein
MLNNIASSILRNLGTNQHSQLTTDGATLTNHSESNIQTIKNLMVALNFLAVRGKDQKMLTFEFNKIIDLANQSDVSPDLIMKILLLTVHQRDIKDGKGERDLFFIFVNVIWKRWRTKTELLLRTIFASQIMCFKDALLMIEKCSQDKDQDQDQDQDLTFFVQFIFEMMVDFAKADKILLESNQKPKTLIFKWLPRQQTHFDNKLHLATRFAQALYPMNNKIVALTKYRHLISNGNRELKTVECDMCSGDWENINPSKVPAKAFKLYRKALLNQTKKGGERSKLESRRNLAKRIVEFIISGKSIHGSVLMPHEIINHLLKKNDIVLEAQLLNLVSEFSKTFSDPIGLVLPMVDVSGSMSSIIPGSKSSCLSVSIALGFLLSQLPGPFFDKVMIFNGDPKIIDISNEKTYYEKIQLISKSWDNKTSNTDFNKAMCYILQSLIDGQVDPKTVSSLILVVFSDMQFDAAEGSTNTWDLVAQEKIEIMFQEKEFQVPHMVYWNLNSSESSGFPAHTETKGVTMLSGFSQASLKSFLSGNLISEIMKDPQDELTELVKKKEKNSWDALEKCFDSYRWIMIEFEKSGIIPNYVAPKDDQDQDQDQNQVAILPNQVPIPPKSICAD